MLIKSEYDIQFHLLQPTPMVALLHLHPSLQTQLVPLPGSDNTDRLHIDHLLPATAGSAPTPIPFTEYLDSFGNRCSRFVAPPVEM